MAVRAVQHFARMRGGAQAQLMLASDGHYYVVKFQNNPQHRRVLANELVAYVLLQHLELPTPHPEVIQVDPELVAASPDLYIAAGEKRIPCAPGLQFGSRYPGDPARLPVYDYVPDSLLREVANADHFLGMVAFDKWVSNADGRQAIFFRDQVARWRPATAAVGPAERAFVVAMIDHGHAFTAQEWEFRDQALAGIYPRPWLYERVTGYHSFEPWLGRITAFSFDVLDDAFKRVPPEWCEGDLAGLERLLERLYERRARVPELLRAAKKCRHDPFPNWSG
jgi:hypothetical protein